MTEHDLTNPYITWRFSTKLHPPPTTLQFLQKVTEWLMTHFQGER